jgi:hypothetical protein
MQIHKQQKIQNAAARDTQENMNTSISEREPELDDISDCLKVIPKQSRIRRLSDE